MIKDPLDYIYGPKTENSKDPVQESICERGGFAPSPDNIRRIICKSVLYLLILYVSLLLAIGAANALGPERWWWSALNLYLPQWGWLVPGACLFALCVVYLRTWLWVPPLCMIYVAYGLMGYCHSSPHNLKGTPLRISTYNVLGHVNGQGLYLHVLRYKPDIIVIQEANEAPSGLLLQKLKGWHIAPASGGLLVASRFPLEDVQLLPIPHDDSWRRYLRCRIKVGMNWITLYNLHLDTPRKVLEPLQESFLDYIDSFERENMLHVLRAQAITSYIHEEKGPVVVAGDLNAPSGSLVCRAMRDIGLKDAFETSGSGYGYTYGKTLFTRKLFIHKDYIRIDHIYTNRYIQAQRCIVGESEDSDHRPVFAQMIIDN